jgi:hypothetical protein
MIIKHFVFIRLHNIIFLTESICNLKVMLSYVFRFHHYAPIHKYRDVAISRIKTRLEMGRSVVI